MIDTLKANAPLFAAALLGWPIWSALGAKASPKDDGQRKLPEIAANDMRLRDESEPFSLASDPCRQGSGQPIGAAPTDPAASSEPGSPGASSGPTAAVEPTKSTEPTAGEPARFSLSLDAVLFAGPNSVAVVNRQALGAGQTVAGADDRNPPVLEEIGATWVRVQYAGRQQRLELDGVRVIQLERAAEKRSRE